MSQAVFGGELLVIDGSKFRAVNAHDQNFNAGRLQELLAHTDTRRLPTAQGNLVGYNAQIAADDVTNEMI